MVFKGICPVKSSELGSDFLSLRGDRREQAVPPRFSQILAICLNIYRFVKDYRGNP
jgi:hypothetical protein